VNEQIKDNADILINFINDTVAPLDPEQERLIREHVRLTYQLGFSAGFRDVETKMHEYIKRKK
jgi:hypothetical protein